MQKFRAEAEAFVEFPTLLLGLVTPDGTWETYDGRMRFTDSKGEVLSDQLDPARYRDYIGEKAERWSYIKSTTSASSGPGAAITKSKSRVTRREPRTTSAIPPTSTGVSPSARKLAASSPTASRWSAAIGSGRCNGARQGTGE